MTAETIHTCSYACDRAECIRAQRDELAARLTTETSNARWESYTFDMIEEAWGDAVPLTKPYFDRFRARLETLRQSAAPPPAAEGVQAGEVSTYDLAVLDDAAETLDRIGEGSAGLREARARIVAALSQQPEARGVVDEAWMQTARELYDRCRLWPESSDDGFMALLELRNHVQSILAALTGERNG